MATNPFFRVAPSTTTNEQNLVEDLVIEALQIYGMDVYYLPRSSGDTEDLLFGEDQLKQYTYAGLIEMYLENVLSMEGAGDFISKFGLEIRDECTLLVARKRFITEFPSMFRPMEGDLIYIPMVQNFFEISFVEHEDNQAMFYTLGKGRGGNVYVYALKLKQYTLSNELIMTGIDEVDSQIRDNYLRTRIFIEDVSGDFSNNEIIFSGDTYETRTAEAILHYQSDDYIDVYRTIGTLTGTITGNTSSNTATVVSRDDMVTLEDPFEDIIDNFRIETEADPFIDISETNPLGDV